jgi:hypothetical protein
MGRLSGVSTNTADNNITTSIAGAVDADDYDLLLHVVLLVLLVY